MAKAKTKSKTWKIGENCKGGIITVELIGDEINIIGKEWDYSKGSSKGSNQSNAKEWTRLSIDRTEYNAERRCDMFLFDLTTSYYGGQVLDWIKEQTVFNHNNW